MVGVFIVPRAATAPMMSQKLLMLLAMRTLGMGMLTSKKKVGVLIDVFR